MFGERQNISLGSLLSMMQSIVVCFFLSRNKQKPLKLRVQPDNEQSAPCTRMMYPTPDKPHHTPYVQLCVQHVIPKALRMPGVSCYKLWETKKMTSPGIGGGSSYIRGWIIRPYHKPCAPVPFLFFFTHISTFVWTSRGHRCRPFSCLPSIFIAHRVQESHCSSRFHLYHVVVVLTLTRTINSVLTGQAPVTLELRNTPGNRHTQTKGGTRIHHG